MSKNRSRRRPGRHFNFRPPGVTQNPRRNLRRHPLQPEFFLQPSASSLPIGVTETHPFWSESRQAFVPIGEMTVGDEVQTLHGETKQITSILPRPSPPEKVYNLEVNGEHTYFIGQQQLLVHNNGCKSIRLGLSDYIDDVGEEYAHSAHWMTKRIGDIAENGRGPLTGPPGLAAQWKYVSEAIKHSDEIVFNLKGMTPENFGAFAKGGFSMSAIPYGDNWTNAELFTVLTGDMSGKAVHFIGGNISEFMTFLK